MSAGGTQRSRSWPGSYRRRHQYPDGIAALDNRIVCPTWLHRQNYRQPRTSTGWILSERHTYLVVVYWPYRQIQPCPTHRFLEFDSETRVGEMLEIIVHGVPLPTRLLSLLYPPRNRLLQIPARNGSLLDRAHYPGLAWLHMPILLLFGTNLTPVLIVQLPPAIARIA
jgi:hypothetical protein